MVNNIFNIKAISMNKFGGDLLNEQILNKIEFKQEVKTRYTFKKKKTDGKLDIEYIDCNNLTKSFQTYHKHVN
jgi:hypothetical protein